MSDGTKEQTEKTSTCDGPNREVAQKYEHGTDAPSDEVDQIKHLGEAEITDDITESDDFWQPVSMCEQCLAIQNQMAEWFVLNQMVTL